VKKNSTCDMEKDREHQDRTVTRDTVAESPTTLSRWSSEPASLGSGSDEATGVALMERARRSVATLQQALTAERDCSRRLRAQLDSETVQTTVTATTFDAILHCVDRERAENRLLHSVVVRQHKTIARLRRQLRPHQRQSTSEESRILSEDLDDKDDCLSDFEMVCMDPDCSNCLAENSHETVRQTIVVLLLSVTG